MNKLISVIIPAYNEEKYITKCLDSIIFQDIPKENLEILVIDGMSEDRTREIVKEYEKKYSFIKLLDNPKKYTPNALNIGIKQSKGDIIIRMDAHAGYQKDYVSKCLNYLEKYKADNVGGIIKTLPADNTLRAKAIALCLSHFFGTGGARFRTGTLEVSEADTVFGGCYKKEVFKKIGLFNENLKRTQYLELNLRLKKSGGKIILAPDIVSYYYPKSNFKDFFNHNISDGIWSIYPLKFVKTPLKLRHYAPLIFILSLPLSIFPYFLLSLFFSFEIAKKEKDFRLFFLMPIAFFCRHFGYGMGSLFGLVKLFLKIK